MRVENDNVIWADREIYIYTEDDQERLLRLARTASLRRARINLHSSNQERGVHEMVVCMMHDSRLKLHRHKNKAESYQLLYGEAVMLIVEKTGKIQLRIELRERGDFIRIDKNQYHLLVCKSESVIYKETTVGPFDTSETDFFNWKTGDEERKFYEELGK